MVELLQSLARCLSRRNTTWASATVSWSVITGGTKGSSLYNTVVAVVVGVVLVAADAAVRRRWQGSPPVSEGWRK